VGRHEGKGTLFMDFRFQGLRLREYTALTDTPANRKRLQKVLDRIEADIAAGTFEYGKYWEIFFASC
jgi:integrase